MWESLVELVRIGIVSVAQVCGGSLGSAVILVSVGVRLALLPLTLRIARQARTQQERLAKLRPAVELLQKRYAKDPAKLWQETQVLYRTHDIRFFTPSGMVSLLVQMPLFGALFSATRSGLGAKIRFLWIAELARPDAVLTWTVAGLTAIVMALGAASGGDKAMNSAAPIIAAVLGGVTLVFLWSASSAVALSVGGGALASGLQSWILSRDRRDIIKQERQ
jgi:YidC/Oxa1 family membrane protein insertase